MRKANVYNHGIQAGVLIETDEGTYRFEYDEHYSGPPISLTMPVSTGVFEYSDFPPFFDGLLPEGVMLAALLKTVKLDVSDYFGQLVTVGADLVGSVTVEEVK